MQFDPGTLFGRYTIDALLGKGGMGEVYRARDTLLQRAVAIKILRSATEGAPKERSSDKIIREARTIAAIQHPNIVSVFDVGQHEGIFFITMEFVEGRSLRSFIGQASIPLDRRIRWLADIGRALDAAHRAGIVHRDIKPENVMITDAGMVKVLDFGIGKAMPPDENRGELGPSWVDADHTGLTGTPRYMAPEQVRRKAMDGRVDQFAWGVVAYELFTGMMPWKCDQPLFELFYSIVNDAPKSPRHVNPAITEALDGVIRRALEKDPERRFATMNDAVVAIEGSLPIAPQLALHLPELPASGGSSATLEDQSLDAGPDASGPGGPTVETAPDRLTSGTSTASPSTYDKPPSVPTPESNETLLVRPNGSIRFPRRWGLIFAVVTVALGIVIVRHRFSQTPLKVDGVVMAMVSATTSPPIPTTMLDLPLPVACNAEALALVQSGIVALHDGDWISAHARFEKATKADGNCAAAFARLSITGYFYSPTTQLHEVYQRALELRGLLGERDQGLLDAIEPLVRRNPADRNECTTRMLKLAKRFPGDAEIAYLLAEFDTDTNRRLTHFRVALSLDPHYADAHQRVASMLTKLGDVQGTVNELDECIRLAPNSVDCVFERVSVARNLGRCEEAESFTRKGIVMAPQNTYGYAMLAQVLAANERPPSAIEEAFQQRWARLPEADAARLKELEQARLDVLFGRFDLAERALHNVRRRTQTDPSFEVQAPPVLLLVNLLVETNRIQEAATIAKDFLERRSVWSAKLYHGDVKAHHLEPFLLDVERKANRITYADWEKTRTDWMTGAITSGRVREATQWALGTAMPIESADVAVKAVASMPSSVLSMDENLARDVLSAPLFAGRTLLLAGRIDDAIRILRYATRHCDALEIPFEDTYANLWLARALDEKHDVAGACAAYGVVVRRWSKAKPPAPSARFAEKRRVELGCTP